MKKLWQWFRVFFTGKPHFKIGNPDSPYMLRWYLIPRNPWLNVYLHKFLRDDDDRALHDHPWWFLSLMIRGAYCETRPTNILGETMNWTTTRQAPSIAFRRAEDRHRVALIDGKPCWTIVVTGPKVRDWGFWCPKGFVVWTDFVARDDHGSVGKGCGE